MGKHKKGSPATSKLAKDHAYSDTRDAPRLHSNRLGKRPPETDMSQEGESNDSTKRETPGLRFVQAPPITRRPSSIRPKPETERSAYKDMVDEWNGNKEEK